MTWLKLPWLVLAILMSANSSADAPVFQLVPIVEGSPGDAVLSASAINDSGVVVGAYGGANPRAFRWHKGEFRDLNALVDPTAPYVAATGINNRSEIVGSYIDPNALFKSFRLSREGLTDIQALPGEAHVFVSDNNNRGQILGESYAEDLSVHRFVWHRGEATLVPDIFLPAEINDRGVIAGTQQTTTERRAAIWVSGELLPIAPHESTAGGINNRHQVIGGFMSEAGWQAFTWKRGRFSELRPLHEHQAASVAADINDSGLIVGYVQVQLPEAAIFPTLWDDNLAFDLNTLIVQSDPLKPLVTLHVAQLINNRSQIVAQGIDSRVPNQSRTFLLNPVKRP